MTQLISLLSLIPIMYLNFNFLFYPTSVLFPILHLKKKKTRTEICRCPQPHMTKLYICYLNILLSWEEGQMWPRKQNVRWSKCLCTDLGFAQQWVGQLHLGVVQNIKVLTSLGQGHIKLLLQREQKDNRTKNGRLKKGKKEQRITHVRSGIRTRRLVCYTAAAKGQGQVMEQSHVLRTSLAQFC